MVYHEVHVPHGLSEPEFEEIMSRNRYLIVNDNLIVPDTMLISRTVSSSAIARAVQDAAAGEYASAIETLVTAISLIKQSKVAGDDRCKILISSLQDTLHGIENKSYGARFVTCYMLATSLPTENRQRALRSPYNCRHGGGGGGHGSSRYSPDRRHRDYRRDYSPHRERERYRERERDRSPRERDREYYRERSRSRERDPEYRQKYYEERERYRDRERDRDR